MVATAAPKEKRFEWSTKSEEAKAEAMGVVNAIETFQFGPQVLEHAKKAVAADPSFAFGQYLVATFTPPPAAAAELEKALELAKRAPDGERRYIEAVALVRQQKIDEALPLFESLAKDYPGERMVFMMLGQTYMAKGNAKAARAAYAHAIELDPKTPRAYAFVGNIDLLAGDYKTARDWYQKSLERKPAGTVAFGASTGIVWTYVYENRFDEAIDAMSKFRDEYIAAGANANFPEVFIWNSIARMYLESNRPEKALEAYKAGYAAVEKSSLTGNDKLVWLGRLHHGTGRALAKLGRTDEAWKEAEAVKTMIEQGGEEGKQYLPAYHYIAGYLKYEAGDYPAAIEHMKQANLADPFHMLVLARAYEKAGDMANAKKYYQAIVDNNDIGIERALAYPEAKRKLKS
jgi:tetratricopeptide (TPR) repeat protein